MAQMAFSSFNTMLSEFVESLADTFDDNESLGVARDTLSGFLAMDPNTSIPLEQFYTVFAGHEQEVFGKDRSLFKKINLPFMDDFDIDQAFNESDEDTHEAIWDYLSQLTTLAMTSKTMTPDMMKSVESITQDYLKKVQSGEISQEDAQNPLKIMMELQKNDELMKMVEKNS